MTAKTNAQLVAEIADNFRSGIQYGTSTASRLSDFLTNLMDSIAAGSHNGYLLTAGAGVPVDYTDGDPAATLEGLAPKGALRIDTTNGFVYRNSGTLAQQAWTKLDDVD